MESAAKVIVTTSQNISVLDLDSSEQAIVHQGRGLYYGMTFCQEKLFVATRNRLVSSSIPAEEGRGTILMFGPKYGIEGELIPPFPLRDIHEIAFDGYLLYIICSYDNMVAIFDGSNWQKWFPLGEPTEKVRDLNHFNSIAFRDDELYLLAHDWGWSQIFVFSRRGRELQKTFRLGRDAHNIWFEDTEVFTCSSGEDRILGTKGFSVQTKGFPRGFVSSKTEKVVGVSELRERTLRDLSSPWIVVYSSSWIPSRYFQLKDQGLLLDIKMPPRNYSQEELPKASRTSMFGREEFETFFSAMPRMDTPIDRGQAALVEIDLVDFPRQLRSGTRATGKLALTNNGREILSSLGPYPVNLSYHLRNSMGETITFDGIRSPLPDCLRPSGHLEMEVVVEIPSYSGGVEIEFLIVQEGCFWISPIVPSAFQVMVSSGPVSNCA